MYYNRSLCLVLVKKTQAGKLRLYPIPPDALEDYLLGDAMTVGLCRAFVVEGMNRVFIDIGLGK